jgi:hypothetical protein
MTDTTDTTTPPWEQPAEVRRRAIETIDACNATLAVHQLTIDNFEAARPVLEANIVTAGDHFDRRTERITLARAQRDQETALQESRGIAKQLVEYQALADANRSPEQVAADEAEAKKKKPTF